MEFLQKYWNDLLVAIVGLSALLIYYFQKRDRLYSAATLIVGQIDQIEKSISILKDDPQLGNISIYNTKVIIRENMWEKYKHLFVKRLTTPEYELVQRFFDHAEQLERSRIDINGTILNAWKDKSTIEHQFVGQMILEGKSIAEITEFSSNFRPLDLVFTPDITINALVKSLQNFNELKGTSAYTKIRKKSYNR